MSGGGAERERGTESEGGLCSEPDVGLKVVNCEIMT